MEKEFKAENNSVHKNKVHRILAHSYSVYFLLFLVGISLDIFFGFKILSNFLSMPVGVAFLVFGTIIIFWAQISSRNLRKEVVTKETFCRGPYCYTRRPTHWGLFFMMLGFGIIINATFVILTTIISFIISKLFFIERQEAILAEKYGAPYLEYKKSVKL